MSESYISFKETNYFSDLICDYLEKKPELKPLYNRYPSVENFKAQIEEKAKHYNSENRDSLYRVLKNQYKSLETSKLTQHNIEALKLENTYTITTGHQLNLFTGPLYFLYKIISTINLSKELKAKYPSNNFVPVFWMASEDHDFDEINYFNFNGKKIMWNSENDGGVGRFSTINLQAVFEILDLEFGEGLNAQILKSWFKESYLNHNNLADATRFLANKLFGDYGLVILDADEKELKQLFIPQIEKELFEEIWL